LLQAAMAAGAGAAGARLVGERAAQAATMSTNVINPVSSNTGVAGSVDGTAWSVHNTSTDPNKAKAGLRAWVGSVNPNIPTNVGALGFASGSGIPVGVYGWVNDNGSGVYGRAVSGVGVEALASGSGNAMNATAQGTGTGLFVQSAQGLSIDASGPANFNGSLTAGSVVAQSLAGDGSGLTNLDPLQLAGVVPSAKIDPLVVRRNTANTFTGAVTAPGFAGSGAGLTSLDASKVTAGTLADARLSSQVPLKNAAANAFAGDASFAGTVRAGALEGPAGGPGGSRPVVIASSGRATIRVGRQSVQVLYPGLRRTDLVIATLQSTAGPNSSISHVRVAAGRFEVVLTEAASRPARVAWVVLGG
jgi:hypothetical protein